MKNKAEFSECGNYRYALWRNCDEDTTKPIVMFLCLNPSTADKEKDDTTTSMCKKLAKSWNYDCICIGNLFARISIHPKNLKNESMDLIGPKNDEWLSKLAEKSDLVVAAWGDSSEVLKGLFPERIEQVKELIPNLHYFRKNESGQPTHPLYVKYLKYLDPEDPKLKPKPM